MRRRRFTQQKSGIELTSSYGVVEAGIHPAQVTQRLFTHNLNELVFDLCEEIGALGEH